MMSRMNLSQRRLGVWANYDIDQVSFPITKKEVLLQQYVKTITRTILFWHF